MTNIRTRNLEMGQVHNLYAWPVLRNIFNKLCSLYADLQQNPSRHLSLSYCMAVVIVAILVSIIRKIELMFRLIDFVILFVVGRWETEGAASQFYAVALLPGSAVRHSSHAGHSVPRTTLCRSGYIRSMVLRSFGGYNIRLDFSVLIRICDEFEQL